MSALARLPVAAPPGFELVREHIGSGKTSRVALVRREEDGALFALKMPHADDPDTRALLEELIRRSRTLLGLGLARGELTWGPGGRVLLQPFVEGTSLRQLFLETGLLTEASDARLPALTELFAVLARERLNVSGLNTENLVFDGERFLIIDCGMIRPMGSSFGAWMRQRKKLARHWVRFDGHDPATVGSLLDRLEEGLGLPEATLRDRLRYRLFKR